jgi:hypothetical protein
MGIANGRPIAAPTTQFNYGRLMIRLAGSFPPRKGVLPFPP